MSEKDQPDTNPTVSIPLGEIVNAQLKQLLDGQRVQHEEISAGFKRLETNIEVVANEVGVVKGRLGMVENRQNEIDEWRKNNSERVRTLAGTASSNDLAHDAKLAQEIIERQALAADFAAIKADNATIKSDLAITKKDSSDALTAANTIKTETTLQTEIIRSTANDVKKFIATPAVKIAGGVIFGIICSYLAQHFGINIPH